MTIKTAKRCRIVVVGSALIIPLVVSFVPPFSVKRTPFLVPRLNGISEWRDTMFDYPGAGRINLGEDQALPKEICILPFPYEEVLLQGETKELRLYEDRFIDLFDYCMEKHGGVVGMGMLADSGIIQTVPLCEVEAYNRMEGFGIFVTIRVMGRATLLDLTQQEPYIKAVGIEISDTAPPNLELPNIVAQNIETSILTISSMEHQLQVAATRGDDEVLEMLETDDEMRARAVKAKLDDNFYDEANVFNFDAAYDDDDDDDDNLEEDDDDDDDEDNDLDEYGYEEDRAGKFRIAYKVAKMYDMQGYTVQQSPAEGERSAQDLTALSWAAFSTEDMPDEQDATYRIQALDMTDLFERLKLASFMFKEKKAELKTKLEQVGINYSLPEESDSEDE